MLDRLYIMGTSVLGMKVPFTSARSVQRAADMMKEVSSWGVQTDLAHGKFQNEMELSIVVDSTDVPIPRLKTLMQQYSQESFVVVQGLVGFLCCIDGIKIKVLKQGKAALTASKPIDQDYTFMPNNGLYLSINFGD